MLIGFTFDLRDEYLAEGFSEEETAEFDRQSTIDSIVDALKELGHTVVRIGRVVNLQKRLVAGERWDLVFNICEGLRGPSRESQVPMLLEMYDIPVTFSDSLTMSLCLHKGWTKSVLEPFGIPMPRQAIVRAIGNLNEVDDFEYPLFAKPVAEGTGKGTNARSKITDRKQLTEVCRELLSSFRQPVLVESFCSGREFTVGMLGTGNASRVLGTLEITLRDQAEAEVYSYENKENSEELVDYRLGDPATDLEVLAAETIALNVWRALGCRDAGRIDLRSNQLGQPQFLEVNPLAGLHPSHSDLPMLATAKGLSFVQLIQEIISSASERVFLDASSCIV